MRFLHTMIRVNDLDSALSFYCDALGLVEVKRKNYPTGEFTLVFLAAQLDAEQAKHSHAPLIEITHNWNPEPLSEGRNFGHMAFEVDNIYQTCQRLSDKGIDILRPPRDGYMAFIRSPDNISIELLQKGDVLAPQEPWASAANRGHW